MPMWRDDAMTHAPIGIRDHLGWSLWLLGFAVEFMADYQKDSFRSDPSNQASLGLRFKLIEVTFRYVQRDRQDLLGGVEGGD